MLTILTVIIGVLLALCASWVAQHVLGTAIGWFRAIVLVLLVYVTTLPLARAALESGDVIADGRFVVAGPVGIMFLALALGWQFTIAIGVIMVTELFWPSGRGWHPIRAVRGMLRRRKRVRRYVQVLRIASRHGLSLYGSHRRGEDQEVPAAVVAAMNEAGVTFVKIGQVLSTRDDILPTEFTDAFATLQMETTPLSWADARAAIEAELPGTLEETFAWVDETPLAAASVAQVHAARLHPTAPYAGDASHADREGAAVVIKIQRPDARASVRTDADIIVRLAAQAERRAGWARDYGLSALVGEFVRSLEEELDYRIELANTELLRGTLAQSHGTDISVPDIYENLCTQRMLVQEYVQGVPFSNLADVRPDGAREIADLLVDSVFEQVAVRGVFHADLHPGNVILRPDGQITLIDLGSLGILERSTRRMLIAMMSAMVAEDDIALTDLLLMITGEPADGGEPDRAGLQREIGVVLTRMRNGRSGTGVFADVIDVLRGHRLSLPPALILVFRTLASLEGTLRQLVPDYDMVERALARTPHFVAMSVRPGEFAADARVQLQVVAEQLRRLPRRIETIGAQLENGTFGVGVRMFRDARERGWVGSLVGELTTALLGGVLVVSSVVMVVVGGGPALTHDVDLYPFLGAMLGLGGVLLVLRSLRTSLMKRGGRSVRR